MQWKRIQNVLAVGLLALGVTVATGCTAGSAAGGGWIPSAVCGPEADPDTCSPKAIFGGRVDCDPDSGGTVRFTYRDSPAGTEGRFTGLIPSDIFGQTYACGLTLNEVGPDVQTAGFLGTFENHDSVQEAVMVLLADPAGLKAVIMETEGGYQNAQLLGHGNFIIR